MSDKIEAMLRQAITDARSAGDLPAFEVDELGVERPADSSNGDWTSTVALRSARPAHMSPARIASAIVAHMPESPSLSRVEIAGPGFINFYLSAASNNEVFRTICEQGEDYGRSNLGGGAEQVPGRVHLS